MKGFVTVSVIVFLGEAHQTLVSLRSLRLCEIHLLISRPLRSRTRRRREVLPRTHTERHRHFLGQPAAEVTYNQFNQLTEQSLSVCVRVGLWLILGEASHM